MLLNYFYNVILIYEYILISRMPAKNLFVILVCILMTLVLQQEDYLKDQN